MTSGSGPISAGMRFIKKVATKYVGGLIRGVFHTLLTVFTPNTFLVFKREVCHEVYSNICTIQKVNFSKKFSSIFFVGVLLLVTYYAFSCLPKSNLEFERIFVEKSLEESLNEDKGTVCEIPKLDPFSQEMMQFDDKFPKIECPGLDWVRCYLTKCKIAPKILETVRETIECIYRDIMYINDELYSLSPPLTLKGNHEYVLNKSDHVKIWCRLLSNVTNSFITSRSWIGHGVGFRPIKPEKPPVGRADTVNVLIFGFESTSKNGFIRKMPKSFKYITEEMGAVVLNGYNTLGEGTAAALFPLLTGKTELELPEMRRGFRDSGLVDHKSLIFYKAKIDGYHTAYFDDTSGIGTFQKLYNGFLQQPADQYLRSFFAEHEYLFKSKKHIGYCVGDTPRFQLMINLTDQFFKLDGKRFAFTFISDICQDYNLMSNADQPLVDFLKGLQRDGRFEDTLIIVMSDHGPRFFGVRNTPQSKLEERLPLMAIRLPEKLTSRRPEALRNLKSNANTLTTPHDIHATLLDALDMKKHWNKYKIPGSDLPRAMTLLEAIPKNRTCSEAGIDAHFCTCLQWELVKPEEPVYQQTARALLDHINQITAFQRNKCAVRTLMSTDWVTKKRVSANVLKNDNVNLFQRILSNKIEVFRDTYKIKITVGPGVGAFEAVVTHLLKENRFHVNTREISRVNAYNNEPDCISNEYPHLNMFCYCIT